MEHKELAKQMIMDCAEQWPEDDIVTIIRFFAALVKVGQSPPLKMLSVLANRFTAYLDANGEKTLDECFGLKAKQGKHFLKQRDEQEATDYVMALAWQLIKENPGISVNLAISEIFSKYHIDEDIFKSVESIESRYSRIKYGLFLDICHEHCPDFLFVLLWRSECFLSNNSLKTKG
ncbi:hypothetical protein [Methylomicrobium sp. Wu6]|uniref:hypothetical protein n=1 Tax=Methylomicrobium sp. Wu6 TaxID=3107928 RepID=UPI002DD64854|nr:hypothetical protein [Methylomicrobium sp. Wu6]MEC4747894.1 hypothetical protein [Methylomicrobium sp. Wu6]